MKRTVCALQFVAGAPRRLSRCWTGTRPEARAARESRTALRASFGRGSVWRSVTIAGVLLAGVVPDTQATQEKRRAPNPCEPQKRVLAAVEAAIGSVSGPDHEVTMSRQEDKCAVLVWSIPKVPGGFVTVIVDAKGKVVRVIKGE